MMTWIDPATGMAISAPRMPAISVPSRIATRTASGESLHRAPVEERSQRVALDHVVSEQESQRHERRRGPDGEGHGRHDDGRHERADVGHELDDRDEQAERHGEGDAGDEHDDRRDESRQEAGHEVPGDEAPDRAVDAGADALDDALGCSRGSARCSAAATPVPRAA